MLPLPSFSWSAPDRLDDVLDRVGENGVQIVAGGTDLLPSLKHRLFQPRELVSLWRLPGLRGVRETAQGGLAIGAMSTLLQVREDPRVRARWPALAAACGTVATRTIQGMGTLGGNVLLDTRCLYYNQPKGWRDSIGGCLKAEGTVCHVAPRGTGCYATQSSDTVPALLLYEAELLVRSRSGERRVPLASLYGEDGRDPHLLRPDELLVEIHLPPPGPPVLHRKVRPRGAIDYGSLLVAVRRQGEGGSAVVSALGPRPVVVHAERIEDLAQLAWKASNPLSTHHWPSTWRKHMVRVEVSRAVAELTGLRAAGP